jgi:catechol 2,3-dioxygenase-like lactoylglutathione lyase family enzyme
MQLVEIAYFTKDVDAMAGFYTSLLGADPVARSEGMAIFMAGATKIFIHRSYTPAQGELPPENHTALAVDDVDSAIQQLSNSGVEVEIPPRDYYWGRSAYLRDPDGHLIEITQADAELGTSAD